MKRIFFSILLATTLLLGLNSCSLTNVKDKNITDEVKKVTPVPTVTEEPKQSLNLIKESKESVSAKMNRAIVKDGNNLFSKTEKKIICLDLTTQKDKALFEVSMNENILDYFIYKDWIYILVDRFTPFEYTCLYRINQDGSNKLLMLDKIKGYESQVYIHANDLYLTNGMEHRCYALKKDGSLGAQIEDVQSVYHYIPNDCYELEMNGKYLDAPYCLEHFNCIWVLYKNNQLWSINPSDGTKKIIELQDNLEVVAITDTYIITKDQTVDKNEFYLTDIKSGKKILLFQGYADYIDYDETGCYFCTTKSNDDINTVRTYKKIAWDGTETTLFRTKPVAGMFKETSKGASEFTVINGVIYYHYADADKMWLMCRNTSSPKQVTKLGFPCMDKMYSAIGHVEAYYHSTFAKTDPDRKISYVYAERFVLDAKTKAAIKINKTLEKIQKESYESDISYTKEEEDAIIKSTGIACYSTSQCMGFTFLSDKYICIYQYGDLYTGGAHDLPYKEYFVFNLKTGNQLNIKNIIRNTQLELHNTIRKYFSDYIKNNKEILFNDALNTVDQTAGFKSKFYLTPEGIGFYYSPYEIASFAAGFQEVLIPYDEFDLRVDLSDYKNPDFSSDIFTQ